MSISFTDAKRAVRRGTRQANQAVDIARDVSRRKLSQFNDVADDAIEAGAVAARYTTSSVEAAHDWMEEKPHLAALAALAAGVILGALLVPRR
jgi:ElaB/YqjD/DUF883 family membrane-anchored ribosome-binding protein